jgi:DNA-binding transcriptional ArsR family regulator
VTQPGGNGSDRGVGDAAERAAGDVIEQGAGGVAAEPVDEVLAALADPTRRRLLDLLAARGAASATELAGELPVTRQAVVKHLAVLDAAGLVAGRRSGREVRFEVRSAALGATARWMASLAADWDRRLAHIKAVAEAAEAAARGLEP